MSWNTSTRRDRLPPGWQSIRRRILVRDQYRCAVPNCDTPATDVDHAVAGDDHSDANLQSLCAAHHARKSSKEGAQARWAKRNRLRRKPEQHPGMIAQPGQAPVLPWQVRLETNAPTAETHH